MRFSLSLKTSLEEIWSDPEITLPGRRGIYRLIRIV